MSDSRSRWSTLANLRGPGGTEFGRALIFGAPFNSIGRVARGTFGSAVGPSDRPRRGNAVNVGFGSIMIEQDLMEAIFWMDVCAKAKQQSP